MNPHILKACYGDIFFEFLVHENKADAIILLPGFPSRNVNNDLMQFLYKKGFHVFFPRYKGSYQSHGQFLETNPVNDLAAFIRRLNKGKARSLWDLDTKEFVIRDTIIVTGSFSGPIAGALAAYDQSIKKIILASPVWDFERHQSGKGEQDLQALTRFVKRAYAHCYRFKFDDLAHRMTTFPQLKSSHYFKKLSKPVLVFHDPADTTVSMAHSRETAQHINATIIEHNLGHGLSLELIKKHWKRISHFIEYD